MRQRLSVAVVARRAAFIAWAAALAIVAAFVAPVRAEDKPADREPDALAFGAGYYDVIRSARGKPDAMAAGLFNLEYRSDKKLWVFNPQFGAWATNDGTFFGYAGIRLDVYFGNRFVFTPSFSPGLYLKGNGRDLGLELEFRSSAELGYRFDDYSRVSLGIAHLSNASLGNKNPGVETLTLTYSVPIRNLLGN